MCAAYLQTEGWQNMHPLGFSVRLHSSQEAILRQRMVRTQIMRHAPSMLDLIRSAVVLVDNPTAIASDPGLEIEAV